MIEMPMPMPVPRIVIRGPIRDPRSSDLPNRPRSNLRDPCRDEANAAANLAWNCRQMMSERSLLADEKPTDETEAHFVKGPDGTWVLDAAGE